MKFKPTSLLFVLSVILIYSAVPSIPAQSTREVLTNNNIIELVRMGLSEPLIVAKIKRSVCRCDTSMAAIAKLKAARVSDEVIMAMMNSSSDSSSEPTPTKTSSIITAPGPPPVSPAKLEKTEPTDAGPSALRQITEPGIYLFEDGQMKGIEASVFSGGKINPLLGTLTYGIKKTSWRAKVRGRSANLQVHSTQPVFYFVFNPDYKNSGATMAGAGGLWWGMPATSPNEFMMVQMNIKENSREAILGQYGVWTGVSMGARDKDVREYSFEKIKPGIYKVVPRATLAPGEYCFYFANNVTGIGFAGGKVFDFSISIQ